MKRDSKTIITYTVAHVGSTLIANINTGLFEPKQAIQFIKPQDLLNPRYTLPKNRITFKSHPPPNSEGVPTYDVDTLLETVKLRADEQTYFVYVNRKNHPTIETQLPNLILLDYERILYKSELYSKTNTSLPTVIDYITSKYTATIPDINISQEMIESAIDRVIKMDKITKQMRSKSFDHVDKFYHIHGSHRGRLTPDQLPK